MKGENLRNTSDDILKIALLLLMIGGLILFDISSHKQVDNIDRQVTYNNEQVLLYST